MALARNLRPQYVTEERQLLLAGNWVGDRDAGDGAVVFAQADRAVGIAHGPAEVAGFVVIARYFADPLPQR